MIINKTLARSQPSGIPRKRVSHSKVKTGCKTCRTRRLKCDERKPSCLRCIQNCFSCEWFPQPLKNQLSSNTSKNPRPILPSNPAQSEQRVFIQRSHKQKLIRSCDIISLSSELSSRPFQSDLEQRYFRVFCENVTTQLAGLIDSPIWNRFVLQASEHNESIRNAIMAVGALDLTLQESKAAAHVDPLVAMDEHHSFAIKQYSKAISQMRISMSENKYSLRDTLLGILLIICFESLHGNHESAIAQACSGLKLLEEWTGTQVVSPKDVDDQSQVSNTYRASEIGLQSPAPDRIEDELVQTFSRLDMHTTSYSDPRPISYHVAFKNCGSRTIQNMPRKFSSIVEAKVYWELVMRRIMHFIASKMMELNSQHSSGEINNAAATGSGRIMNTNIIPEHGSTPTTAYEEREKYVNECLHWSSAYSSLRPALDLTEGSKQNAIDHLFWLRYKVVFITLLCTLSGSQMVYDQYLPDFREVVNSGRIVLANSKTIFTFHSEIIPYLYVTAIRCRDRIVRRDAIKVLLSRPFREGVWDSIVTGKMAAAVMEVEEEGLTSGEIIPEEKRVRGTAMSFDMEKRSGQLKCFLKIKGKIVVRKRDLTW